MGMGKFVGDLIRGQGMSLLTEFMDKADLDKDGKLDKVQVQEWMNTLGGSVQKVDEAIDQEKLISVAKEVTGTLHAMLTYLENLKKNL